jgi:Ca2+/Na+ antiporter
MNPLNNYRFGAYALFAMGLINLRYQTGSEGNLSKSAVLVAIGAIVLVLTFIPKLNNFFMEKLVKLVSLTLLAVLIAYGILI